MWFDASVDSCLPTKRANRLSAAAVGYLDLSSEQWTEFVTINTLEYPTIFYLEAELLALQEAFRIACTLSGEIDYLLIFSDCATILEGLRKQNQTTQKMFPCLPNEDVVNNALIYANILYDFGIEVELRWVPAHSSVEGSETVDKLAKNSRHVAQSHQDRAQTPDAMLKGVTATSSSRGELYHTLSSRINRQFYGDDENIYRRRRMKIDVNEDEVPGKNIILTEDP